MKPGLNTDYINDKPDEQRLNLTANEIIFLWEFVSGDRERFRKLFAYVATLTGRA